MQRNRGSRKHGVTHSSRTTSNTAVQQRRESARFTRSAWGDQSLEERIPTFLEALYLEPEAGSLESLGASRLS